MKKQAKKILIFIGFMGMTFFVTSECVLADSIAREVQVISGHSSGEIQVNGRIGKTTIDSPGDFTCDDKKQTIVVNISQSAQGRLPQTDSLRTNSLTLLGYVLVVFSFLLLVKKENLLCKEMHSGDRLSRKNEPIE